MRCGSARLILAKSRSHDGSTGLTMRDANKGALFGVERARASGGATYDSTRDFVRLHGQLLRTWNVMLDRRWHTLGEIARHTSVLRNDGGRDSEAAVSARLRDLRKAKFGGHVLEARC